MVKTIEEFINVNDRAGKILVFGLEGSGKTLLLSAIAIQKMLNCQMDILDSYSKVDELNSMGYSFSQDYEHLVFSAFIKINCSGTNIPDLESYKLNPFKLGLSMPDYETDFYPPGAWFFIPECQRVFNSYMQDYLRPEVSAMFETSRQAGYSLIMDCQRPMLIAKNIRDITNRFIRLYKPCTHELDKDGNVCGHNLYVHEFHSNKDVEVWDSTGVEQNYEEYTLHLTKCYFDNYDSYFFRYFHLKGRSEQDFTIEKWPDITDIDDVEALTDEAGMTPPEGYYKKKSDLKKGKSDPPPDTPHITIYPEF